MSVLDPDRIPDPDQALERITNLLISTRIWTQRTNFLFFSQKLLEFAWFNNVDMILTEIFEHFNKISK